jgi:fructokinase
MVSECCADRVGDIIIDYLTRHHVDITSIDRYTTGATAMSVIFDNNGKDTLVNYGVYPEQRFDVVWPRIDENDILLFGSLYAITEPQRKALFELVNYAVERKAIILYLPGFQHGINFHIAHVMPAILENLEVSDLVIAHERDLRDVFPGETAQQAYTNHVEFYCNNYLHIHPDLSVTRFDKGGKALSHPAIGMPTHHMLGWQAGFTAGVIYGLLKNEVTHANVHHLPRTAWVDTVTGAQAIASACANPDHCIDEALATRYAAELK